MPGVPGIEVVLQSFNPATLEKRAHGQQLFTTWLASAVPVGDAPASVTRQNFVDDHIFNKLNAEGVQPAGLATDEEFMRRVTLDLTGRPPDIDKPQIFLKDQSSNKRQRLIDDLLNSEAFVDRWAYWLCELVRNTSIETLARPRWVESPFTFWQPGMM